MKPVLNGDPNLGAMAPKSPTLYRDPHTMSRPVGTSPPPPTQTMSGTPPFMKPARQPSFAQPLQNDFSGGGLPWEQSMDSGVVMNGGSSMAGAGGGSSMAAMAPGGLGMAAGGSGMPAGMAGGGFAPASPQPVSPQRQQLAQLLSGAATRRPV